MTEMLQKLIVSLVVSLIFGGASYLTSDSFFVAPCAFVAFFSTFFFVIAPFYERYFIRERKRHECYRFVSAFVIGLSVNHSGEISYQSAIESTFGAENETCLSIADTPLERRLEYFNYSYFEESYYKMFLSLFRLYEDQGGDVLTIAGPLLDEATSEEEKGNSLAKVRSRHLIQWISLWGMSLLILVFVRFGLASFYKQMCADASFMALLIVYFVIALVSFFLYGRTATDGKIEDLRRKKDEQKPLENS